MRKRAIKIGYSKQYDSDLGIFTSHKVLIFLFSNLFFIKNNQDVFSKEIWSQVGLNIYSLLDTHTIL